MKYIKSYILLALMVLAVTGCKQEDLKDDVNALKDRVTLLEEQVKLLNENIAFFSKVLVRQTVDNGDGTVTEVPAYSISKITLSADNTSYTAVFNDGQTLTLTIGSKGTVTTPQISVNQETGKWMLQGADTGYSAVGIDSNENGATPEFQVVKDENTQQYYWQVKFDDSTGWQDVTDASNQKVYVTEAGTELAKDQLFEKAEIEGSEFVLTYYVDGNGQGTTQEVRLPILSDLSCIINVPESEMADGYWEISADGASAEVEIKGEHWFVVAPHGWEASISETLTDGKVTLTVKKSATASAGLKSRATANNTDEVVVQVNKGMYWAVAKVKIREKVTDYFNQVYSVGQNIVVGEPESENGFGVNINNSEYSDGVLLQDAASISDNGVYFIKDGATVTLGNISDLQSLVIVGNNPDKPSTIKVDANSLLLGATGGKGIVMKNVILDAENAKFTNGGLIATTVGSVNTKFERIIFDGCEIRMLTDKRLVYLDSRTDNLISTIVHFALYNTKVKLPLSSQAIDMFFIYKDEQKTFEGCEMVVYKNNVFYAVGDGKALINFALLQANTSLGEFNKVIVQNNTLVNLLAKNILVRAKMKNLSVTNNLLWNNFNDTETTRCIIGLMPGSNTASILYGDNKAYDPSTDAKKWTVFNKGNQYVYPDPIEGGNNLPIEAVDPFATEGGSMDWDAGIFVPGAGYENIGAHIN